MTRTQAREEMAQAMAQHNLATDELANARTARELAFWKMKKDDAYKRWSRAYRAYRDAASARQRELFA